jgi:hypothetical protein
MRAYDARVGGVHQLPEQSADRLDHSVEGRAPGGRAVLPNPDIEQ